MTFTQELNCWCRETQDRILALEKAMTGAKETQKVILAMVSSNMVILGVILAAVLIR